MAWTASMRSREVWAWMRMRLGIWGTLPGPGEGKEVGAEEGIRRPIPENPFASIRSQIPSVWSLPGNQVRPANPADPAHPVRAADAGGPGRKTMSETRRKLYLSVPDQVHQLARIGAAALGVNLSEYVAGIVLEDAVRRGVDEFVRGSGAEEQRGEMEENHHG